MSQIFGVSHLRRQHFVIDVDIDYDIVVIVCRVMLNRIRKIEKI